MTAPKVLVLDIETSPHIVYTWTLRDTHIGLEQIIEPSRMLSWAAKWHGEDKVFFGAEWSHDGWVEDLYDLMCEADAWCHYNGDTFDVPIIRREVDAAGLGPIPGTLQIDLLKSVRKFRLASSKLDWAAYHFLGQRKVAHDGFPLWRRVLDGDKPSRRLFEEYNRHDVELTDDLLTRIKPHLLNFPSTALAEGVPLGCRCGATDFERRGFAYTAAGTRRYQRLRCKACGAWSKATHSDGSVLVRGM